MSSTESKLMWAAIALSVLLVVALGTLAVYSVLGQEDDDETGSQAEDGGDTAPADPVTVDPTPAESDLVIGDIEQQASVVCRPSTDSDQGYRVVITNRGDETIDYIVSIELAVSGGPSLVATADVPRLEPGMPREVSVAATGPVGRRITDCSIAAVQSDRRVLLAIS